MNRGCNRWLVVSIAGAALLFALARGSAAGKQETGKPLLKVAGELTAKDSRDTNAADCYCKDYPIELETGATYRIDLVSTDFDAYLRLVNPAGKEVANDDNSGGKLNARIIYKAAESGRYKIIASTYKANETGKFTLTATAVAGAPQKVAEKKVDKKPLEKKPQPAPLAKAAALAFPAGKSAAQVSGQLDGSDPTDEGKRHFKAFTITLTAGKEYRIVMKGGKDLDAYVRLDDASGNRLTEDQFGQLNESGVKYTPAKTAPYRIVCTSYKGGMTGGFTLSVTEIAGTSPPPTKQPQGKQPEAKQPQGKQPQRKQPEAKQPEAKQPEAKQPEAKQPAPGAAGQALNLQGDRPVTVEGQITKQDSRDNQGQFFKVFTFEGQFGKSYQFEVKGKNGFNPVLRIENGNGRALRYEDTGGPGFSRITYQPPVTGTLRLIVAGIDAGKTGSFTLTGGIQGPPPPNQPPTVAAMPAFQPVVRTQVVSQLTRQDGTDKNGRSYKVFTFQAKPNKLYLIEMSGHTFPAQLRLEGAGAVAASQEWFDGNHSHIVVPPGKGGSFRVIASAFAANQFGNFTLSITERDPAPAVPRPVVFNRLSTIKDRLTRKDGIDSRGKFHKVYVIHGLPSKLYECDLRGKDFEAELRLEDDKGQVLQWENLGDRNVSRLDFKCDTARTYHLIVAAMHPGQVGEYTLTIAERDKPSSASLPTAPTVGAPPDLAGKPFQLANGKSTVDSTITETDARDNGGKYFKAFPFAAAKGKWYRFEATGKGGLEPFVRIEDEDGKRLKEEDFGDSKVSRILFHAYAAGTYRVVATTFKPGQTGSFTLSAREVDLKPATAVPLKLAGGKARVQGQLTSGDAILAAAYKVYKEYTFTADAGKTYRIDLHGGTQAFDAYLYLKDAAGKTLAENDDAAPTTLDSRIVHTAAKAETYHIIATTLAGGTGPFVLTVAEAGDADKLASRINELAKGDAAERKKIVAEVEKHFKGLAGKLTEKDSELAMLAGNKLEDLDKQLAIEAYTALGKILAGSKSANIAHDGKTMLGAARRLGLVGNILEIKGTTTGGKAFDLAKQKGKVVLVDFWATWCGPCKEELPNVRKLYAKYHAKGFDVIGISLDNKESDLASFLKKEALPWPSIYKEANDIADDYGVFSIPQAILVGRDGRVLSLNARGPELERLLEDQFKGKK